MSTKGPSNLYGSHAHGPTDNIAFPWAKAFNKRTLKRHFRDHGGDFHMNNKGQYEANNVDRDNYVALKTKKRITYKFNKKTDEFVVVDKNGYIASYYVLEGGLARFNKLKRQKKDAGE